MDTDRTSPVPTEVDPEPAEPVPEPEVKVAKNDGGKVDAAAESKPRRTKKQIEAQKKATATRAENLRKMQEKLALEEEKLRLEEAKALLAKHREEKRKAREQKQVAQLASENPKATKATKATKAKPKARVPKREATPPPSRPLYEDESHDSDASESDSDHYNDNYTAAAYQQAQQRRPGPHRVKFDDIFGEGGY
ncbi:hypothetical protein DFS34DRAFT_654285 [Phlyctochytrium arcticum]|nr:hypothetical protein DFS34DRAFT_654285 [Phlyctochytrium arcticum]